MAAFTKQIAFCWLFLHRNRLEFNFIRIAREFSSKSSELFVVVDQGVWQLRANEFA